MPSNQINRRAFLEKAAAVTALASTRSASAADASELKPIQTEIDKRHDEAVHRLQEWIHQPSIAAENRGMTEGCDLQMRLLRDAGFNQVTKVSTAGHPGVFATLDAGAPRTYGIYFMYDVKQVDPSEWSSPPWDAALVDKPGLGKILIGRGAVNTKGPQSAFISALHAFKAAGRKLPVNLVFVAEGEEEIGGPMSWPRCANAMVSSCPWPRSRWTAPSPLTSEPRVWSSWSWFRVANGGAEGRSAMSIRAMRHASTVRPGI